MKKLRKKSAPPSARRARSLTLEALRTRIEREGLVEAGSIDGTQFMYIRTSTTVRIFNTDAVLLFLQNRPMDAEALQRAQEQMEMGCSANEVARNLGFSSANVIKSLLNAKMNMGSKWARRRAKRIKQRKDAVRPGATWLRVDRKRFPLREARA